MYDICSMLTKKQKNLLLFINKKIRSTGVSPSYEEMKNSLNLKSKSGIHRLISALEERRFRFLISAPDREMHTKT